MADTRSCGHAWRNNDFDCMECVESRTRRLEYGLRQILEGRFRYNMGDYETCAKNAARIALSDESVIAPPSTPEAIRAAAEAVGEYLQAPPSMWNTIERLIEQRVGRDEAERDAMIETIRDLERDRNTLKQVARMALQQFEFTYGKRQRGWDAEFLMGRLRAAIAESEGTGEFDGAPPSEVIKQARAAAEHLERENFLLSDVTPEERDQIASILSRYFGKGETDAPNTELRSACCDAPTRIANTDYNVCTACKEACDTTTTAAPAAPSPAEPLNDFPFDRRCYYCRNKCCHDANAHNAAISERETSVEGESK